MKKILLITFVTLLFGCRKDNVNDPVTPPVVISPVVDSTKPPTANGVVVLSSNQLKLKWTDNSTSESKYSIERKVNNNNFVLLRDLPANSTEYVDSNVSQSQSYTYRITAVNSVNSSSTTTGINSILPNVNTLDVDFFSNLMISASMRFTDGGDSISEKGIIWSTNPNPNVDNSNKSFGINQMNDSIFRCHIITPTPGINNNYYIRAYAVNPAGIAYGVVKVINTNNVPNLRNGLVTYFPFHNLSNINTNNNITWETPPGAGAQVSTGIGRHKLDSMSLNLHQLYLKTNGNVLRFQPNESYSVSFWIKIEETNYPQMLFSSEGYKCAAQYYNGFLNVSFGENTTVLSDTMNHNNNWINYTITYDGIGGMIKMYKNGQLKISRSANNCSCEGNFYFSTTLATPSNWPHGRWMGLIDGFGTWNRVLTQQEITYISQQ